MKVKVENPYLRLWLFLALLVLIIISILGIMYFLFLLPSFSVIVMILAFSFFLLIIFDPILHHPKTIDFNDDGVIIEYPIGKNRTVKWGNITKIVAIRVEQKISVGLLKSHGELSEKAGPAVALSYEAVWAVRDEYFKRFGLEVNKVWQQSDRVRFR
jgi:hypothetical protein